MPCADGWDDSAAAWVAAVGEQGDYGRRFVLDAPMLERIEGRGYARALDLGCGEGRFCRMMQSRGIATVGIDPTKRSWTAPEGSIRPVIIASVSQKRWMSRRDRSTWSSAT